jgi:N4-gp56 family major capsid protein
MAGETGHSTAGANFGANVLTDIYLQKIFQDANRRKLVVVPLGKQADLPENMGKTVRWNRMVQPAALSTVAEGSVTTVTLTTVTVTSTLLDYAASYGYTRFMELTAISGTIPEIVETAGYQMALSAETITYSSALTDATQIDAGVGMTAETLRSAVAALDGADAVEHPMAAAKGLKYCGVFSPEQGYDMMGEGAPTWWQAKNSEVEASFRTPWGDSPASAALYNTIIKTSTVVTTQSASSEEFGYVVGGQAFGTVSLGPGTPMSPQVYITRPSERVDRAARDQGTIGTYMLYAAELLAAANSREIKSDIT